MDEEDRNLYSFKLNNVDNVHFLACSTRLARKIKQRLSKLVFKREITYVKIDKAAMDYYMRLTNFHSPFLASALITTKLQKR